MNDRAPTYNNHLAGGQSLCCRSSETRAARNLRLLRSQVPHKMFHLKLFGNTLDQFFTKVRPTTKPTKMDCLKCHQDIEDSQVFNLLKSTNNQFHCHQDCCLCQTCGNILDSKAFAFDNFGKILCSNCYTNLPAQPELCHLCDQKLESGDFAFTLDNVKIHQDCLSCKTCNKNLAKGDQIKFNKEDKEIYCSAHASSTSTADSENEENEETNEKNKKRTPRTKFTEKQTSMMMQIFAQTPRPTRLMREQMARDTGLPIRCIQIWFQNKRSKEKRQNSKRFMHLQSSHSWFNPHQTYLNQFHQPAPAEHLYPSPPPSDMSDNTEFYNPPHFDNHGNAMINFPSPPWNES